MAPIKVVLANLIRGMFYSSHPATIIEAMTTKTAAAASMAAAEEATEVTKVEPIWVKDNCLCPLIPASWMMR